MGMDRAAREGRYCGGIVSIGYRVEGKKPNARLVVSDTLFFGDWSESGFVRAIYGWLLEGWTAPKIADHLNELGVPTVYQKDNREVRRGERKQRTDAVWRPGRILSIVKNPVYKGQYHYGRNSKKGREPIVAEVPALISAEAWDAAQAMLASNRIIAKNTDRRYLLRSRITCNLCGLVYGAMMSHGETWYRCGGQTRYRANTGKRCPSVYLRAKRLEPLVWADVEAFLRNPGAILDRLQSEKHETNAAALREAELAVAEKGLAGIPVARNRVLDFMRRGHMTDAELERQMLALVTEEAAYRTRIAELTPDDTKPDDEPDLELIDALRARLDDGLDERMRQEIVSILVRSIRISTEVVDGRKRGTIVVEYRFPGVADTDTGRGSARRRA